MNKPIRIYVVRLTQEQVAKIIECLIKSGDLELAKRVLAQASKARG